MTVQDPSEPRPDSRSSGERQADQSLEEEARLQTALLDNIPGCIALIIKKDTREIVASNRFAREIGAVPGQTCFKTCAQRDDHCPFCLAPELWATGQSQRIEVEYRGTWYEGTWVPLSEDLYVHYIFDISERKQMEELLRRTQFVVDHSQDPIQWVDSEGRVLYVNDASCRRLGYSREELMRMSVSDIDVLAPQPWSSRFQEAGERGFVTFESLHRAKDGEIFPVEVTVNYLNYGGREYSCATARNITERKRVEEALRASEDRYQNLVNLSPDAIAVDIGGTYVFANPAAARLFGAASPREIVGKDVIERVHPDYREVVSQRAAQVRAGSATSLQEIRILRLDGSAVDVEVSAARIEFDGSPANQVVLRDITERKRAERALRLARFSIDFATDFTLWVDFDGSLIDVSQSACARLGYSRDELLNMSVFDITVGLSSVDWPDRWRELRHGPLTFEKHYRTKGGEILPVEISSTILEHEDREYNVAVVRDITDRKRREQELRIASHAIAHAAIGVMRVDEGGRIREVNGYLLQLLGYSREELLQMTVFDVTVGLEASAWPRRWEELKKLGPVTSEKDYRAKSGETIPVEISLSIVEFDGNEYDHLFVRDIIDRKRSEEALRASEDRYQNLVNLSPDAIVVNAGGNYVFANPAAARLFGAVSPREIIGRDAMGVIHPEYREAISRRVDQVLAGGTPTRQEIKILRLDGSPVEVEAIGSRIEFDGRSATQVVFHDITERKQAEDSLRQSEERLRESQKMEAVGQLAGGIAHDFNNLLTAILGYSEMILASKASSLEEIRPDLEEIKHAGQRASALTQQILAFSRRQILRPAALSLNEVVEGMESLLGRTLGEDIDLVTLKHPGLGLTEVDRHQFEQVLLNLALNARDAMPSGGRLTIETANVELGQEYSRIHPEMVPGSYVMLSVSDTGLGMDPDTIAHAFEPFFTTKAFGAGTGLGLAVIHGIVTQSHGSISVYSEPGEGATFKIYLPRALPSDTPEEVIIPPHVSARGHETVLVVEDEGALRGLVERVLGAAGYTTLAFGSADEALEALGQGDRSIDMLLTDVMLPGALQGHDLARAVLASQPGLPVLYMSGYARDTLVHAGRLDEGVNLLEKPFTGQVLVAMVRTVLDQPRHLE